MYNFLVFNILGGACACVPQCTSNLGFPSNQLEITMIIIEITIKIRLFILKLFIRFVLELKYFDILI